MGVLKCRQIFEGDEWIGQTLQKNGRLLHFTEQSENSK